MITLMVLHYTCSSKPWLSTRDNKSPPFIIKREYNELKLSGTSVPFHCKAELFMRHLNKQMTKLQYCRTYRANFLRQDWRPCYRAPERLQNGILVARQQRILKRIKTMKENKHMKKNLH